jgi:hypothetical protein
MGRRLRKTESGSSSWTKLPVGEADEADSGACGRSLRAARCSGAGRGRCQVGQRLPQDARPLASPTRSPCSGRAGAGGRAAGDGRSPGRSPSIRQPRPCRQAMRAGSRSALDEHPAAVVEVLAHVAGTPPLPADADVLGRRVGRDRAVEQRVLLRLRGCGERNARECDENDDGERRRDEAALRRRTTLADQLSVTTRPVVPTGCPKASKTMRRTISSGCPPWRTQGV